MHPNEGTPVIVAGVGELDGADPAVAAAAQVAAMSGGVLHLVHAYELPPLFTLSPGLDIVFPEGADSYHDLVLGKLQGAAALVPGAERAVCHVVEGRASECLSQAAERMGAALVVVGATRGGRLHRALLGTTAQRVLRESPVPVLVARGPIPRPLQHLLLATDLSEQGARVLATAAGMVTGLLQHAGPTRALYVLPWSLVPEVDEAAPLAEDARKRLDSFLTAHADPAWGIVPVLRIGAPADEIVAEAAAWPADLLVVGTHARGWGARLLLGSVAEATIRDAPCAVLAVPPVQAGERLGAREETFAAAAG